MLKQLRREPSRGREMWVEHWDRYDELRIDREALRWDGFLDLIERFAVRGRILEAGCGPGRYLLYLHQRGSRVTGIDFAVEPLRHARSQGEVRVAAADVTRLPFADASFDAILCLGVVEHFEEGPQAAVRELARVLKPGGRLLISVPYANIVKRWLARRPDTNMVPGGSRVPSGWTFYQHCFSRAELHRVAVESGLSPISDRRLGRLFWLASWVTRRRAGKGETPASRPSSPGPARPTRSGYGRPLVKELAFRLQVLLPGAIFAHMIMGVCEKPQEGPAAGSR